MKNEETRLCGSRVYNSKNCNNRIRKYTSTKFENIYLLGKHAFKYSVIQENKLYGTLKETIFPTRKEALCFFALIKQ